MITQTSQIKKMTSKHTIYFHDDFVCMISSHDGTTPLFTASENGHSQVAELLLSKGADVNLPDQVQ